MKEPKSKVKDEPTMVMEFRVVSETTSELIRHQDRAWTRLMELVPPASSRFTRLVRADAPS